MPPELRGLPASPFLVPAVLDALSKSQYASILEIVPGEAEAFCAFYVRENGGIALTSDSDMLVHDLNSYGAVAFFNQLECRSLESCEALKTILFRPNEIANTLGLKTLQRLAFEIKQDPYIKIQSGAKLAQQPPGNPAALAEFLTEYDPTAMSEITTTTSISLATSNSFLDPRLSELVLSATSSPRSDTLPMYLPFLTDDPSRASAWAPSSHLRQLLYSSLTFLSPLSPDKSSILEYTRKGHRIASTQIPLLSNPELHTTAKQIIATIHACSINSIPPSSSAKWWVFAFSIITTWHHHSGKPPPSRETITRVCNGAASPSILTWEEVHLSAQIQGVLYSLRMLKQLFSKSQAETTSFPASLLELRDLIQGLPDLAELLPSRLEIARGMLGLNFRILLDTMVKAEGLSDAAEVQIGEGQEKRDDDGFETVSSKKRRKTKKGKGNQQGGGSEQRKMGAVGVTTEMGNRYGFLATE